MSDPNIFYDAMDERDYVYVVSNGNQTKTVLDLRNGMHNFYAVMNTRQHEDEKYRTSRITGVWSLEDGLNCVAAIAQLRMNPWLKQDTHEACDRVVHRYEAIGHGVGYCVTTYQGDNMEPSRFYGEPYLLPLMGEPVFVMETLWETLDPDTRLGIAIKRIDPLSGKSEIWFRNS